MILFAAGGLLLLASVALLLWRALAQHRTAERIRIESPLGREKARVFTLNLRNRLIFKAADEEGAVESADFLGRKRVIKKSWGYSGGRMSRNYSEQEEHKMKPHLLRSLSKHTAVVVHCEQGYQRKLLPPLEADGKSVLGSGSASYKHRRVPHSVFLKEPA